MGYLEYFISHSFFFFFYNPITLSMNFVILISSSSLSEGDKEGRVLCTPLRGASGHIWPHSGLSQSWRELTSSVQRLHLLLTQIPPSKELSNPTCQQCQGWEIWDDSFNHSFNQGNYVMSALCQVLCSILLRELVQSSPPSPGVHTYTILLFRVHTHPDSPLFPGESEHLINKGNVRISLQ